jgi:acyl-CoA thioesterase I
MSSDHILFYGDSITDCGRVPSNPDSLGQGYVYLIAAQLLANEPDVNLKITNRGIGGNRIQDLENRLQADVLDLKPTVVSILIGINDTWRRYDSNVKSDIAEFKASYARVLDRISATGARIILMEPFLLPIPEDRRKWREDLDPRITSIRELAWDRQLPYLPLDGIFAAAATSTGHAYWAGDGVHPSLAGHGLIAEHWLDLFSSIAR